MIHLSFRSNPIFIFFFIYSPLDTKVYSFFPILFRSHFPSPDRIYPLLRSSLPFNQTSISTSNCSKIQNFHLGMMNYAQKMYKCSQYVDALEVKRQKIQVFQRELPLCIELVSQAIDACRQQLSGTSEQTSSHGPVLEEFIPINRAADDDVRGGGSSDEEENESGEKLNKKCGKKSDWLRSVHLWNNQSSDPAPVTELKKDGGFRPFDKEKVVKPVEIVENKQRVPRQ